MYRMFAIERESFKENFSKELVLKIPTILWIYVYNVKNLYSGTIYRGNKMQPGEYFIYSEFQ